MSHCLKEHAAHNGIYLAVLCAACLAANYAARAIIPVVAHARCPTGAPPETACDATALFSAAISAFFAGDLIAQFAAGPLVRCIRGGKLLSLGTAAWGCLMVFMPAAVQGPRALLLLAQVGFGLAGGLAYPSAHAAIAEAKIDTQYRTLALSLVNSAAGLGSMLSNYFTPLAVHSISWSCPFFVFAGCGLTSASAVGVFHSEGERIHLDDKPKAPLDPLNILYDARLWLQDGLVRGVVATMYLTGVPSFGLVAFIPTLFMERYGLRLSSLGNFTTAPPMAQVAVCFITGALSDYLIRSKIVSTKGCRQYMQLVATAGPACSLLLLARTDSPLLAALLVTLWLGTHSFWTAGCVALIHDVAKARAGELFVVGNIFSKSAALLAAPLIRTLLRSFGWDFVIFVAALHYILAGLVLLPWMRDTEKASTLFQPVTAIKMK